MNAIHKHLSQVSEGMTLLDETEIQSAIHILSAIRKAGGTVYLFGNGGSYATATHFTNDLIKMCRISAVCLGDMASAMLAYGNDEGWNNMFARPLSVMLRQNDGVVGISCGGSSPNVLAALEIAKGKGNLSIGMTGLGDGTPINQIRLDALIHVRVPDIRVQEDVHMMVCHAIVRSLQEE